MGSSIALAAGALSQSAAAILLVLADQPLVTASHLQQLVDTWRSAPDAIVASAYADVVGPPVVFPSRFFRQLTALRGDTGARGVLHANAESVSSIEFNPAAIDIDRPEDLDRLG
jgi:CTP:molybdopterin cytidylyltransferase MocA